MNVKSAKKKKLHRPARESRTMTTAEATVETMLAHGYDTVYALPGVHNDHLFDAFHRAGEALRVVHTRHEQGAAYMALGAALATGKPQAYAVVPGPGLLNSGAALLTAYGMNAAVLALVGQIENADIGRGLGHPLRSPGRLHEIRDQAGIQPGWSTGRRAFGRPAKHHVWLPRHCAPIAPAAPARRRLNARSTFGDVRRRWLRPHHCRSRTRRSTTTPSLRLPSCSARPSAP
jgi:hypothetical protein